jgi:hypothetical protein
MNAYGLFKSGNVGPSAGVVILPQRPPHTPRADAAAAAKSLAH